MSTYDVIRDGDKAVLLVVLKNGDKLVHSRHPSTEAAMAKGEELFGSIEEERPEEETERVKVLREAISNVKPDVSGEQLPLESGAVVAGHLAPELGSDPIMKALGRFDMRRMGISTRRMVMAKNWFSWRARKEGGGSRFWGHIVNEDDNRGPSIEGLGRRQSIQMQGATVGGHAPAELEKPGWIQRHFTERDWKEKQEREMRGY